MPIKLVEATVNGSAYQLQNINNLMQQNIAPVIGSPTRQ